MKMGLKLEDLRSYACLGIRLLALFWIAGGLVKLAAAALEFSQELDRLYWVLFFKVRAGGPLFEMLAGAALAGLSRPLARWVAAR